MNLAFLLLKGPPNPLFGMEDAGKRVAPRQSFPPQCLDEHAVSRLAFLLCLAVWVNACTVSQCSHLCRILARVSYGKARFFLLFFLKAIVSICPDKKQTLREESHYSSAQGQALLLASQFQHRPHSGLTLFVMSSIPGLSLLDIGLNPSPRVCPVSASHPAVGTLRLQLCSVICCT